jgi:hypothetical protein
MTAPRIYADFQNLDDDNRLRLNCRGTLADLQRHGVQLRDGLRLTFYTDDADDAGRPDELLIEGEVRFNDSEGCWVAAVDWTRLRHASEEKTEDSPGARDGAA